MSSSIASCSYLPIISCYSATCYIAPTPCSMAEGPTRDLTLVNPSADNDTGSNSGAESIAIMTSSPTHGATLMAKGEIPELSDFFKKTSITDEEYHAYHNHGWLPTNAISTIPELDIPTIKGSTIVCFELHMVAGLGLPPSKFLVTIMCYMNCKLFYFNANAISTLSSFVMLYECWLGVAPDTSLFWCYYSPA
jgi:hypothetical protein